VENLLKQWKNDIENIRFTNYVNRNMAFIRNKTHQEFDANKKNKNCWVLFKTKAPLAEAVKLNNIVVDNIYTLRFDYADPTKQRSVDCSIFVGGLPLDATENDIREHFVQCGVIVNVRIIRNKQTLISKGCGFVEFQSVDCVNKALDLHLSRFKGVEDGKVIRVIPWLSNPALSNPKLDGEKHHLKQVLSVRPNQIKTKNGGVLMRFDNKNDNKTDNVTDENHAKYYQKGRDQFMNKLRWKDHPELKEKALKKII